MTPENTTLDDISPIVSESQLRVIALKLHQPQRVLCPYNQRYADLPQVCLGYRYVCPHLHSEEVRCTHPAQGA